MSRFTLPDMNDMTDNCNVNVGYFGDALYAMTETAYIYKIDPETLENGKKVLSNISLKMR